MEYRPLGRTGLLVSTLSFGTMTFGGSGQFARDVGGTDVAAAREQIARCVDAGVNLFDTADIYSAGAGGGPGPRAGRAPPRRARRDQAPWPHGPRPERDRPVAPSHRARGPRQPAPRLCTDHIDLLQVHGFDARTDLEETLHALDDRSAPARSATSAARTTRPGS